MAWKSDLHGFYQSSRNDGFLNRFHCRDEDEAEEDKRHTFDVGSSNHEGGLNDGRFYFVEMQDNSELFKDDEGEVKNDSEETVVRNVPVVLIQPPTPSYLSSHSSSSIGSSRPDTPEADNTKIISDRELCLSSGKKEPELSTDVSQETQTFTENVQCGNQVDRRGEYDIVKERGKEFMEKLTEDSKNEEQLLKDMVNTDRLQESDGVTGAGSLSIEERGGPMMEGKEEDSKIGKTNIVDIKEEGKESNIVNIDGDKYPRVQPVANDGVQNRPETCESPRDPRWCGKTLVSDNIENDLNSTDQVNNTLLTSWTEQRIRKEISNPDVSDTVTFGHKADSSPTITWRTKTGIEPSESTQGGYGDTGDDILQTSIGSATDLREILERSLQKELESFEQEKDENIGTENWKSKETTDSSELGNRQEILSDEEKTLGRRKSDHVDGNNLPMTSEIFNGTTQMPVSEKSDKINDYVTLRSNLGKTRFDNGTEGNDENQSVNKLRDFNETEDNNGNNMSLVATISDETIHHWTKSDSKDSGLAPSLSNEFVMVLEHLEAIAMMKSVEEERERLEAVKGIRSKMEESCNGLPIEKVPPFVYDQWEDLFHSVAEKELVNFQDMQTEYESKIKDMKSDLEEITKDNIELSRMATDYNSCRTENELLRRQIGGLEEFVSSLERRIEGRAKENTNLIEELNKLRSVSAEEEGNLKVIVKSYESELKESRTEVTTLKDRVMKLENEIKMKEIENRKMSAESEKAKDEMEIDFKEVNSNIAMLRSKLTDLQNENQTFKTANEADQTIIKHLEAKLQNLSDELKETRSEKSRLLKELEESRIREADLRKKQYVTEKERSTLENEKDRIMEKLRVTQDDKKSIEKQLNEKMTLDTKNAEAMLKEIKSLESFLNTVRSEKTHIEEKYNDLRFQLERVKIIESRHKEISETYNPERIQKKKQSGDSEPTKEDYQFNSQQTIDSRRLLDPKYPFISRSFGTTRPLETSETNQPRLSFNGLARSTNLSRFPDEDNSNHTFPSTSAASLPKVVSPRGDFIPTHYAGHKLSEKRFLLNDDSSQNVQPSFDREYSSDTSLVLKSQSEAQNLTAHQDSDEGSVGSYSDFPRESASLPSVLVVQTNMTPSKNSDSNESRRGYVGNARTAERGKSRLVEREGSRAQTGSRDWKQESTNAKQLIGDTSHENEDKSKKSNSYSAEDTK